jgi:glutamyl-tRNA reductase
MSKAAAEYIYKWGGRQLVMVNRTVSKIADTAALLQAQTLSFDDFVSNPGAVGPVRAILTATSSSKPVITASLLSSLNTLHGQKPVVVDLALPADTAEDAKPLCRYIGLETIKRRLEENRARREEAAAKASMYVEEAKYRLEAEWIALVSAPVLREFQQDVLDRSRQKLELLLNGHLSHLSSRDRRILHDWAIRFNRDMNRIHRAGVERMLKFYYNRNSRNPAS